MVNKALYEIDMSGEWLAKFGSDPMAFLDEWEAIGSRARPPYPRGGKLTSEEKAALAGLEFGFLYGMGANPFLLWQFARSVCVPERMTIEKLIEAYRAAVEPHGYPDVFT